MLKGGQSYFKDSKLFVNRQKDAFKGLPKCLKIRFKNQKIVPFTGFKPKFRRRTGDTVDVFSDSLYEIKFCDQGHGRIRRYCKNN